VTNRPGGVVYRLPAFAWFEKGKNQPADKAKKWNYYQTANHQKAKRRWEFIRAMLDHGNAVEQLAPVWFTICLSDRPKPTHKLARILLNCVLVWDNGKVLPIQSFTDEVMLEPNKCFHDGFVVSFLQKQLRGMPPKPPKVASDRLARVLTTLMQKSATAAVVSYLDVVLRHMNLEKSAAVRQLQASVLQRTPLVDAVKMAYPHLTLTDSKIIAAGVGVTPAVRSPFLRWWA
jgi:hypothetical protein